MILLRANADDDDSLHQIGKLLEREVRLREREERLLKKPFLSQRTIQIMFETLTEIFPSEGG